MADEAGVEGSGARGAPRIVTANRAQLQLRPQDLESLLPADHRARALWMVVDRLDLSRFYAAIQARGSDPGRPAIDPKVLVALWLYATSEGVGSARELARLCELRAPGHVEHRFRRMPNTDSGASRTPIPTQAEHRFRAARTP